MFEFANVKDVKKLLFKGITYKQIAEIYGVSVGTVFNFCTYFGINKKIKKVLPKEVLTCLSSYQAYRGLILVRDRSL